MSEIINIKTWPKNVYPNSSKLRKSVQTKQRIMDVALGFLWSHSFRDLTVAVLTKRAGVSRTCFYQYFSDLHNLMEGLLDDLEWEILTAAGPWFAAKEDLALKLSKSLYGLVKVCYQRGPILRAIFEAAPMDERLEKTWKDFITVFDDTVTARIMQDQAAGLAPDFDPRSVAIALNRMDVGILVHHFGRDPRSEIQPVYQTIARIWISTIYGEDSLVIINTPQQSCEVSK